MTLIRTYSLQAIGNDHIRKHGSQKTHTLQRTMVSVHGLHGEDSMNYMDLIQDSEEMVGIV